MKVILSATALAILALGLAMAVRLGAFQGVELSEKEDGPFRLAYLPHVGAYYKIVPVIQKVEEWAKAHGEPCARSFGEYVDDPRSVDEDRLRSNGGCVLDREPAALPDGFKFKTLDRRLYLTARFRGAPSIGPYKVYPRAASWMQERGYSQDGPTIEMYRVISQKDVETVYYFPLSKDRSRDRPDERSRDASSTTSPREGS